MPSVSIMFGFGLDDLFGEGSPPQMIFISTSIHERFYCKTSICLMSQSWDNVASIHDYLLTVNAHKT